MEAFVRKFQPKDEVELELVTEMVAARWRLRRVWLMQTAAIDLQMDRMAPENCPTVQSHHPPHPAKLSLHHHGQRRKSLQLLLRYETTYSRAFDRVLKTLEKLQKSRPESVTSEQLRNEPQLPPQTAPTELKETTPTHEIDETTQPTRLHPTNESLSQPDSPE